MLVLLGPNLLTPTIVLPKAKKTPLDAAGFVNETSNALLTQPGVDISQAAHVVAVCFFRNIHTPHFGEPSSGALES